MISPIGPSTPYYPDPNPPAATSKPQQSSEPQDSVHLSPAALKATGDVDHDGDRH